MRIALTPSLLQLPAWLRRPPAEGETEGRTAIKLPPFLESNLGRTQRAARATVAGLANFWEVVQDNKIPRLMLILLLFTVVLGVWLYNIERSSGLEEVQVTSMENGLWWAIVTMTTTGYGDLVPKTTTGRLVATATMLSGMAVTALLTGSIASVLVAQRLRADQGLEALDVRNHMVICGWNDRAEEVIAGLISTHPTGRPNIVLVNELPEDTLAGLRYKYRRINLRFVRGDPTNEQTLERAAIGQAGSAIVLADTVAAPGGEDLRTTVIVLTIEKMNSELKTTAELRSSTSEADVRRVGVDDMVVSGQDAGFFLSAGAIAPGLGTAAREMLRAGGEAEIRRQEFPPALRGRTYAEAFAWYRQHGILLAGVISERINVTLDDVLGAGSGWVNTLIKRLLADATEEVLGQDQEKIQVLFGPDDDYVLGSTDAALIIGGSLTIS